MAVYQILCMHSEGAFQQQYEIQPGELGRGRYTVVKKAIKGSNGKEVAVKEIYKGSCDEEEIDAAYEEVKIMRRARHPNCISLYEVASPFYRAQCNGSTDTDCPAPRLLKPRSTCTLSWSSRQAGNSSTASLKSITSQVASPRPPGRMRVGVDPGFTATRKGCGDMLRASDGRAWVSSLSRHRAP
eukprot:3521019-Rhodomonas_salina.2